MPSGSPTTVTVPNDGFGFVGYAPGPKTVIARDVVAAVEQVERLDQRLRSAARADAKRAAIRRLTVENALPSPAFRAMNSPSTIGRPGVPWIVVTPDVMLNGSAE